MKPAWKEHPREQLSAFIVSLNQTISDTNRDATYRKAGSTENAFTLVMWRIGNKSSAFVIRGQSVPLSPYTTIGADDSRAKITIRGFQHFRCLRRMRKVSQSRN